MVLKKVTFRLKEKQKKDFKGKCETAGKSMYAVLQWLADKYIKGELTQNPASKKADELQKQSEEMEKSLQRLLKEKDAQIEELRKETNLFNIEKKENISLLKKICFFALQKHQGFDTLPLSESEIQFCHRLVHRD